MLNVGYIDLSGIQAAKKIMKVGQAESENGLSISASYPESPIRITIFAFKF